jgi:LacI family repressor for deo operon, udp, cdd, tsx, nupC, and nupG
LTAAQELRYRPNAIARSLRTQRTQMIALLVADIANAFYHSLARSVQDVARKHQYEVMISNSDHIYEYEQHFCEVVSNRSVDGVIMVPIHLTTEELSRFITEANTPLAVLGRQPNHPRIDSVFVDDERATFEAICWMIDERGYRDFGFLGVTDDFPPGPRRFRGFQRAVGQFGLEFDPRFRFAGDFTMESGRQMARELLQVGEMPRALFVLNDLMAIGAILTLQEAGYRIPEDVAVMGFDDITEATIVRPTLTTIAQDPRDIGRQLATMLFERIENPNIETRRTFESTCELVVRDSA